MQRIIRFFNFIKFRPKAIAPEERPAMYVPIKLRPKTYDDTIYRLVGTRKEIFSPKTKYELFFEKLFKRSLFIRGLAKDLEEEQRYGAFFLLATLFAAVGALWYFWLSYEIALKTILAGMGINLSLVYFCRRLKYISAILLLLLSLVVGLGSAKLENLRYSTNMLGHDTVIYIQAKVLLIEQQSAHKYRLLLKLLTTQQTGTVRQTLPEYVRLSAREIPADLTVGDELIGRAFLRSLSGPVRPDNYDFAFYSYFQGIGAQGFFIGVPQRCTLEAGSNWLETMKLAITKLRLSLGQRIKKADSSENGAIAAALIAGTRGGITPETNSALRMAGLAHILAISGLHMSMITGLVFFTTRGIFALFMVFASCFSIKKLAAFVALIAAAGYFMLSGGSPSAQRSFIMVSIIFIAIILDRRAITMHNLSIAIWIALLVYPHQLLDPSFQMSFSAAGALIAAYGFYTRLQRENGLGYIPTPVAGSVWLSGLFYVKNIGGALLAAAGSSLIAGAASGIFAAYHFGNTAPFGAISNALVFPIITFIIMPFAVLTILAMPLHLEFWPILIMCRGITLLKDVAFWVVSYSPNILVKYISSSTLAILSLGFCLLIVLRTKLRLVGLLILAIGAIVYYCEPIPLVVISENGKMVAALANGTSMALAYKRPSKFILLNWQKAFIKTIISLPSTELAADSFKQFVCKSDLCVKSLGNGEKIYIAGNETARLKVMKDTTSRKILFLNYTNYDMQPYSVVENKDTIIITKRDLAQRGAVEIFKNHNLVWAVNLPVRPWNEYRNFFEF